MILPNHAKFKYNYYKPIPLEYHYQMKMIFQSSDKTEATQY